MKGDKTRTGVQYPRPFAKLGLGWVRLGWVGLGWVRLGWVGLGWVSLG